jgi:hypothetical protein
MHDAHPKREKVIPLTPSGEPAQSYRQALANLNPADLQALSKRYRKTLKPQ